MTKGVEVVGERKGEGEVKYSLGEKVRVKGTASSPLKYSSGVRKLILTLSAKSRSEHAWSAFRTEVAARPPASPTKKLDLRSRLEVSLPSSRSRSSRSSCHMPVRGLR